jgi:hypothetical protein
VRPETRALFGRCEVELWALICIIVVRESLFVQAERRCGRAKCRVDQRVSVSLSRREHE